MYDKQIDASAASVSEENAEPENTSGMGNLYPVPGGVPGWSWGAFLLNWIWGIFNRAWIGLVVPIPWAIMIVAQKNQIDVLKWPASAKLCMFVLTVYAWIIIPVLLGKNGRVKAWRNKRWESLEHFNKVQRRWSIFGVVLIVVPICLAIGLVVMLSVRADREMEEHTLPAYQFSLKAAAAVGNYLEVKRRLPADLHQAGFDEAYPADIQDISLNQDNGQLKVVLSTSSIRGLAIYLAPRFEDNGKVTWRCLAGEVRTSLLPSQCKFDTADDFYIPPVNQH